MKNLGLILVFLTSLLIADAQTPLRSDPITIKESGYFVASTSNGYKVNVAIIVSNPYDNRFASRPTVQVTLRAADNSIISSREVSGAGVSPLGAIALCETLRSDVKPIRVDFRPLGASYESTEFKSTEFKPYTLSNIRARLSNYGDMKITGEIGNPYAKEAGAWIYFLFRDKQGKLIGGQQHWKSEVPAGEPVPFEMSIPIDELPESLGTIDEMAFSHNNYQSSWREILRK